MLVAFSLLCFTIFSSIPPAEFIVPSIDFPRIVNIPEASPWDPNYSWWHFWMDGRMNLTVLEMGRFVFYITHMFRGDYGLRCIPSRGISLDPWLCGIASIPLIIVGVVIALWIIFSLKLWNSSIHHFRTANSRQYGLLRPGLGVMLIVITGLLLAYFVSITCPFLFRYIIFWRYYGNFDRENFNLYDPRYFALPAFGLAGAIIIGWKLAIKIQALTSRSIFSEDANPSGEIKQAIIQTGLRTGFFCTFILSAIIFIEASFPFAGLGRLFYFSLLGHDYPLMNTILFLSGIAIIVISFSAEVIYGLLQFGPSRSHRIWLWKLRSKTVLEGVNGKKSRGEVVL